MNNMREMLNLMESVVAVPGIGEGFGGTVAGGIAGAAATKSPAGAVAGAQIGSGIQDALKGKKGLEEKSKSEKQARFMAACAHGADYSSCPDDSVSKEFNQADKGTSRLSNAMKHKTNEGVYERITPEDVEAAYQARREAFSTNAPNKYELAKAANDLAMEYERQEFRQFHGNGWEDTVSDDLSFNGWDDTVRDPLPEGRGGPPDVDTCNQSNSANAAEACKMKEMAPLKSVSMPLTGNAKKGEIEETMYDAGFEEEEELEEDLQNGYNDQHYASGNDYFPNGADGPVVRKVGPSGARHGDNPEQKKMQIEEVHRELVYGYRRHLQEAKKK